MTSVGTVLSFPIPPYANVPIEPQNFQPSQFIISNIMLGNPTTVTTTNNMNYVIGQLVRLLIPTPFGSFQLNEQEGYVVALPALNQIKVNINSTNNVNAFISTPFTANITGATQSNPCVLTVSNSIYGNAIFIKSVGGMTQLNGSSFHILSQTATTITIDVNSTFFSPYTSGGTATAFPTDGRLPQIVAVGDINNGIVNASGRSNVSTLIPGSFQNIST